MNDPGLLLSLGKVVGVYEEARAVDVFLIGGGLLKRVPVLSAVAGSHEGSPYLADVVVPTGEPSMAPSDADTYCLVANVAGDIRKPYVIGFLFPRDFETSFKDLDVNKRLGGTYTAFDPDGFEVNRPDGTYIRVGTTTSRVVDGKTNEGRVPFDRTRGTATGTPHIFIKLSNGVQVDFTPAGQILVRRTDGTSFDLMKLETPAGQSVHLMGLT